MIQAVVFDLGHTLWDIKRGDGTDLERVYSEMRDRLSAILGIPDLPSGETFRRAVRDAYADEGDTYYINGPELRQPPTSYWVAKACRSLRLSVGDEVLESLTPPLFATEIGRLEVDEATRDAVRDLRAEGFKLGCITNTEADVGAIHAMLRQEGFFDLFDAIVVSSEEGWRKPHPSLFARAISILGVDKSATVFVGDSPYHDIGGAKSFGMRAILTTQYAERPWVDGVPDPDAAIAHMSELRIALDALNSAT